MFSKRNWYLVITPPNDSKAISRHEAELVVTDRGIVVQREDVAVAELLRHAPQKRRAASRSVLNVDVDVVADVGSVGAVDAVVVVVVLALVGRDLVVGACGR